jgi:2-dehydro-3-deoxyphosphogalactonate aldolase
MRAAGFDRGMDGEGRRMDWETAFKTCPLVAILRGITSKEILATAEALVAQRFTLIEVPLNSPSALDSIRIASRTFCGRAILGAGTVLRAKDVQAVHEAGGRLIVSPNFDPRVAAEATRLGMVYGPGVGTASEAFAALEAGATFLKLFPAEMIPPIAVRALRAVLPGGTRLLPVGGITPEAMAPYRAAGADGFGLGSALFRAGLSPSDVAARAATFRSALDLLPDR